MGMIKLDNIEESLRKTRIYLSLAGIGYVFKKRLAYALYLFIHSFLASTLFGHSIYHYLDDIEKVSNILHHFVLMIDVSVGSVVGYLNHDGFNALFSGPTWSYDYESHMMSKKVEQVKGVLYKNNKDMYKYIVWSMFYVLILMNSLAFCERYLNKDDVVLFPCNFPFPVDTIPVVVSVVMWQEVVVIHMAIIVFSSLLIMHIVYGHIMTEIEILKFSIENIEERAHEMAKSQGYSDGKIHPEILRHCHIKCTRMCAEHHSSIFRYFHDGEFLIKIVYFLLFITGLVAFSCTGFALISENKSLKIKFTGIILIQIVFQYIMCWFAEEIAEQTLSVGDVIFGMEWYRLPKECQTILIVMMIRANKPMEMKMLTGQKVDLAAYMALIKASYSYFNMVLATTE